MTKEIIVDMVHVQNEAEVIYRFYKALDWFPTVDEDAYKTQIESGTPANLDAFADNISTIDTQRVAGITELRINIVNYLDIKRTTSKTFVSKLLLTLAYQTDPSQRGDGLLFSFKCSVNETMTSSIYTNQKVGSTFMNYAKLLPLDNNYKEYDVNVYAKERDSQRFVRNDNGEVYYSSNHYGEVMNGEPAFVKIIE